MEMTPLEMLEEIDDLGEGLTAWEIGFVAGLIDKRPHESQLSSKQIEVIERIYKQRVQN